MRSTHNFQLLHNLMGVQHVIQKTAILQYMNIQKNIQLFEGLILYSGLQKLPIERLMIFLYHMKIRIHQPNRRINNKFYLLFRERLHDPSDS